MKKILLVVAVVVLYVLHQDIWFWRSSYLVFGFIPIGLFYQGCFSVAATLLMLVVRPAGFFDRNPAIDLPPAGHGA